MTFKKSVLGIYETEASAHRATHVLMNAGFTIDNISALLPDSRGSEDVRVEMSNKAPEGATIGGSAGGVAGGVLGALLGLGAITIPGLGILLAAGPIVAAMSGVAAGAVVGGMTGGLVGLGVPEVEAKRYEGSVKKGNVLLSVHVDSSEQRDRAKEILESTGAHDVTTVGEKAERVMDQPTMR